MHCIFDYDKESGTLTWKKEQYIHKAHRGRLVDSKNQGGYIYATINSTNFYVHRLIFFIENGYFPKIIDHINGNVADNRIINLRAVTNSENLQNQYKHRAGKLLGTTKARGNKWTAQTKVNGKHLYIGRFETELEAHKAYLKKRAEIEKGDKNGA